VRPKEIQEMHKIPDPYFGQYTPRRDPIPNGYWTQNPYGKPYFVGNPPHTQKLLKEAKELGLYDGREHPWNPTRAEDPFAQFQFGIPGRVIGFSLFGFWFYLYWDIFGRDTKNKWVNSFWRVYYCSKLDHLHPIHWLPEDIADVWPERYTPPSRESLLPPVTDDDIEFFFKIREAPQEYGPDGEPIPKKSFFSH